MHSVVKKKKKKVSKWSWTRYLSARWGFLWAAGQVAIPVSCRIFNCHMWSRCQCQPEPRKQCAGKRRAAAAWQRWLQCGAIYWPPRGLFWQEQGFLGPPSPELSLTLCSLRSGGPGWCHSCNVTIKSHFLRAVSCITAIGARGLIYFLQNLKLGFLVHICLHVGNLIFTA